MKDDADGSLSWDGRPLLCSRVLRARARARVLLFCLLFRAERAGTKVGQFPFP